nr:hypothetical protein [Pseudomonas putida]
MNSDHANRLATVIRSIGSDALGPAIDTALKGVVDFDMSCAYLFRFNQPALLVHDGYNQRVTERTLKAYLRGRYLLDPFYVACTNNAPRQLDRRNRLHRPCAPTHGAGVFLDARLAQGGVRNR